MSRDENEKAEVPWRVQISDDAHELTLDSEDPIYMAARSLRENGFVVLDGDSNAPLVSAKLIDRCKADVLRNLSAKLEEFTKLTGRDPRNFKFLFKEICHRSYLRYDLLLDQGCWEELFDSALAEALPVLEAAELAGHRILTGCVVSMPGSKAQHVHQDGPDGQFVNVFVPLVDVDETNGPTEFIPGSHKCGAVAPNSLPKTRGPAPQLKKGNILIFRYTCAHWGHKNIGLDPRPVAYFSLAPEVPKEKGDGTNFGSRPLVEAGECEPDHFKPFTAKELLR